MKANELRIGNLVWRIQRVTEVHTPIELPLSIEKISRFEVDFIFAKDNPAQVPIHASAELNDICGIPITDERLLKLGFVKLSNDHPIPNHTAYEKDKLHIKIYNSSNIKKVWFDSSVIDNDYFYIHEIQNLYFTLYGEDISIKNLQWVN